MKYTILLFTAICTLHPLGAADSKDLITVRAAGRGRPWINLRDGRDVSTVYRAPAGLRHELENGFAHPIALGSGDFDEDGVPDLVAGYAATGGGIITLHRGNVDSLFPSSLVAQQRRAKGTLIDLPFLPEARVFELPEAPDFVGTGDFDADGHWDVVAATRDGNALWLLRGNGQGSFGDAKRIELPGRVSALVTGEINRVDGLTDVAVGVMTADGPKVMIFESPDGALRGRPEIFGLPAEATALALGRLDDDYTSDLAVGARNDLVVVYGRDRKLSLDEIRQAEVPKARTGHRSLPFVIQSLAIGAFTADHRPSLSLLAEDGAVHLLSGSGGLEEWTSELLAQDRWFKPTKLVRARVSIGPVDDIVLLDSANRKLKIMTERTEERQAPGRQTITLDVMGEPVAVLPMRLGVSPLSDLVILRSGQSMPSVVLTTSSATFTVTNTNDDGPGSLRQAILDANTTPDLDTINFSIGSGVQTINVGSTTLQGLPAVTSPVIIDGTTQPGYSGSPLIELSGASAGTADGLVITGSTVKGLVINRFGGNGIGASGGGNVIAGNFIGTDVNGTVGLGNTLAGVSPGGNSTVGGTTAGARNVISANGGVGIDLRGTGSLVQGNYIGTDVSGTASLGNLGDAGVLILSSTNNTIGGAVAGARNVISANNQYGIDMGNNASTGNLVQGNYIGTNAAGTAALGNANSGLSIRDGGNQTIGGTTAGARNVISGNRNNGIEMGGMGTSVQGNYIGTDVTGTVDLGNSHDGVILGTLNATIGGTTSGARNLISGNDLYGIEMSPSATGTLVQGNYIGTDVTGTAALGNSSVGVFVLGGNNMIGGTTTGASNAIAFNGFAGVAGNPNTSNPILSNSIFSNSGLGIDFHEDGVTPNNPCEINDPSGSFLQNFPVLTSASTTSIQGTLNSTLNTTFTIQFFANTSCDPSGYGEGQIFLGSAAATTDASCNASFTFPTAVSQGQFITATATDPSSNTSEFSQCRIVNTGSATHFVVSAPASATANSAFSFSVTAQDASNNTATGYTGTVHFTSSDAQAVLPVNSNLTNGVGTFSATLRTLGSQTLAATDTINSSITGNAAITVIGADLSVTITDSPDPVVRGNNITYNVTVANNGPATASNVSLADAVPVDTAFVSNSGSAGWECTNPRTNGNGSGAINCTRPSLPSGASSTFTIMVGVKPGTKENTIITSTAAVASSTSDPNSNNNSATTTTTVIRR